MRLNSVSRSQFTTLHAPQSVARRQPVDSFTSAAKAPAQRKQLIESAGQSELDATLNVWVDKLAQAIGRALESFLSKFSQRPAMAALPENKPGQAGAGLEATPMREVPGQVALINTIKQPNIAPKSTFRSAVNQAIDVVREKGIGIDSQDRDVITDFDAYHAGVVSELRARGYNAAHDGEELAVGRRGDGFSEQFDISTSTGRVRRFYAAHITPAVWA